MSRRDTLATVELVEDDDDVPDAPVRSRKRWWLLAVPVVAAVLVAGVQLVADALESAADARVAALPGAVDPLGDHATCSGGPTWASARSPTGWSRATPCTACSSAGTARCPTTRSTCARASGCGPHRSAAPIPAQTDPTYPRATVCEPDAEPGAEPERVVCLVTDGAAPFTRDPRPATRSRVVVLDLADGHVLADHPAPSVSSFAVLPGLTATAVVEDRHIVVVAADPLTGRELWRYRHAEASEQEPAISAGGGVIVVFGTPGGPVVLSASGDRVPTEPGTTGWGTTQEGWFVTERSDPAGQLRRVVRPGEPPVEVVGRLLDRRVDDGSVPGLEVSRAP